MSGTGFFENKDQTLQQSPIARMLALGREVCYEVRTLLPKFINDPQQYEGMSSQQEEKEVEDIELHNQSREDALGIFFDRDESKKLGKDLYTHFMESTDKILTSKIAACQEGAMVALRFLFEKIKNNYPHLSNILDAEIVDYANEPCDHTFVRIFLKSDKKASDNWEEDENEVNNSVILDVWTGDVFQASQMETRLTNGNFRYYKKTDSFDNTELSISKLDSSLQALQAKGYEAEGMRSKKS